MCLQRLQMEADFFICFHLLLSVSICSARKYFAVSELQMETDEADILQTFFLIVLLRVRTSFTSSENVTRFK